jgi:hypothetical protein
MKVRGRREQRAESTKKTCDDGGEVHGSRSNLEAALQARYGGRLEACTRCEECKSQGRVALPLVPRQE